MKQNGKARASKKGESGVLQTGTAAAAAVEPDGLRTDGPSQDDIAVLAYLYWEARGCQDGSPEQDWFRAERELRGLGSQRTG